MVADCAKEIPTRVPTIEECQLNPDAAYLHLTSNETISGAQWKEFPKTEVPLVVDMSSDILSRPSTSKILASSTPVHKEPRTRRYNLVIIKDELAARCPETVPQIFRYQTFIDNNSLFNTVPTFPVYMLCLVTRWLKANGGLNAMHALNQRKAAKLYDTIDSTDFYSGTAIKTCRSDMNVTWRIANEDLESVFIEEATKENLKTLKGHRSVGGVRASIYNAFPEAGVDALISFMKEFEARHG